MFIEAHADRGAAKTGLVADLDESDTSAEFELAAVDVEAALDVVVLPIQEPEFT